MKPCLKPWITHFSPCISQGFHRTGGTAPDGEWAGGGCPDRVSGHLVTTWWFWMGRSGHPCPADTQGLAAAATHASQPETSQAHSSTAQHSFPSAEAIRAFIWSLICCWEPSCPQRPQSVPGTQKHTFLLGGVPEGWHIFCFTCSCLRCSILQFGYVQFLQAPTRNVKWKHSLLEHCCRTRNRFCFTKLKGCPKASWAASVIKSCLPRTWGLRRLCSAQRWCCCPQHCRV